MEGCQFQTAAQGRRSDTGEAGRAADHCDPGTHRYAQLPLEAGRWSSLNVGLLKFVPATGGVGHVSARIRAAT